MIQHFNDLNNDQLDGLAKLSFDLSRAALLLVFLPLSDVSSNIVITLIRILIGLFWGLVFVYLALVILRLKKVG